MNREALQINTAAREQKWIKTAEEERIFKLDLRDFEVYSLCYKLKQKKRTSYSVNDMANEQVNSKPFSFVSSTCQQWHNDNLL